MFERAPYVALKLNRLMEFRRGDMDFLVELSRGLDWYYDTFKRQEEADILAPFILKQRYSN